MLPGRKFLDLPSDLKMTALGPGEWSLVPLAPQFAIMGTCLGGNRIWLACSHYVLGMKGPTCWAPLPFRAAPGRRRVPQQCPWPPLPQCLPVSHRALSSSHPIVTALHK